VFIEIMDPTPSVQKRFCGIAVPTVLEFHWTRPVARTAIKQPTRVLYQKGFVCTASLVLAPGGWKFGTIGCGTQQMI
jgi:hypothetical protein